MADSVLDLSKLIASADAILVVTGAGVSTETGIPDFRGPQGVWKTQRPVMYRDFLANEEDRVRYWQQKVLAAETIEVANPGAVHKACVELEDANKLEAIVTQNIDGLHSIAGSSKKKVIEIHGTGRRAVCLSCGEESPIVPHLEVFTASGVPPRCHCGGLLKPATISFGQQLDPMTMVWATQAAEACDLVIAMGTTLAVYPAAEIPLVAARRGAPYVIINQGATEHDAMRYVTLRIDGPVGPTFSKAVTKALTP
jgi:NAD-dependent deacetylase